MTCQSQQGELDAQVLSILPARMKASLSKRLSNNHAPGGSAKSTRSKQKCKNASLRSRCTDLESEVWRDVMKLGMENGTTGVFPNPALGILYGRGNKQEFWIFPERLLLLAPTCTDLPAWIVAKSIQQLAGHGQGAEVPSSRLLW